MSGGNGLWFVVCVPTENYENERLCASDNQVSANGSLTSFPCEVERCHENRVPLEKVLRKTLDELGITDAIWMLEETGKFYKVTFSCSPGQRCDVVLTSLTTCGIGMCKGSTLGILPCSVLLQDTDFCDNNFKEDLETAKLLRDDKESDTASTLSKTKSDIKKAFRSFKDMQKKFLKTVTARLTVAQVVEGVRVGAEPSFDFIVFVVIASMIAGLGLLENSSVAIVASMLISPIMGPILAATFGTVIRDASLRNLGIKTEIVGLLLCIIFGFLIGLLGGCFNLLWGQRNWPTEEMVSRGRDRSLWIGVLIALPSGVGVALSVLAGNAGCLVGVAISASLLPPTVNAGLFWGLSLIRTIRSQGEDTKYMDVDGRLVLMKPSLIPRVGYEYTYFEEMDKEFAMLGLVSLFLALVNIVCIFIAAVVVLKIKEVAPTKSFSKTSKFWKEHIKIARDYNSSMPTSDPQDLGTQFLAEWASLNGLKPEEMMSDDEEATITRLETLRDIMHDVEADEVFQSVTQSVVNRKDSRPLSQRLSATPSSELYQRLRSASQPRIDAFTECTTEIESKDGELDGATTLHNGVELRRPQADSARRSSVAILRQSLLNSTNPYTLWPVATERTVADLRYRNRCTMVALPEEIPVVPPRNRRQSRFLQEAVVKETSC